ncbi:hypothetical protein ACFL0V_05020 [Nanoarchaeota archaeon]
MKAIKRISISLLISSVLFLILAGFAMSRDKFTIFERNFSLFIAIISILTSIILLFSRGYGEKFLTNMEREKIVRINNFAILIIIFLSTIILSIFFINAPGDFIKFVATWSVAIVALGIIQYHKSFR